jgi:DNA uptake protein ComE-like DNA-binding protein
MMWGTRQRQGSALVAVLVIVVIGVLLAAGIMARAVSRFEDSSLSLKRSGSRAMAWSGVQAAMATMAAQREQLLTGADVTLTDAKAWEFADTDGPGVWKVSLLPLDDNGTLAMAESALVNVNTAREDQLSKVPSLGSSGAAGVMVRRNRGPILAVEQVSALAAAGATPSADGGEMGPMSPTGGSTGPTAEAGLTGVSGLWLTALSADATVMIADGKTDRYRASELVAKDLPAEIDAAQQERLGAGLGAARTWAKRPGNQRTLANLVADLRGANVKPQEWGRVLDAVEVSEDLFVLGRLDINRADEAVLATLPGITTELASNLVRVRSTLDESGRRDLAWPVVSGATDAKVFEGIVDLITTRTMQYRIRVQAGRTIRSDATGVASDEFGVAKASESAVTDRCIFEAVIDVAGDKPRVAYLRDVTLLESAAMMAEAMATSAAQTPNTDMANIAAAADEETFTVDTGAEDEPAGSDDQSDLRLDRMERSGRLGSIGRLESFGGLDRSGASAIDRGSASDDATSEDAGMESTATTAAAITRADPRLGRWNTSGIRASERPTVDSGGRSDQTGNSAAERKSSTQNDGAKVGANDGLKESVKDVPSKDAGSTAPKKAPARNRPERKAGRK